MMKPATCVYRGKKCALIGKGGVANIDCGVQCRNSISLQDFPICMVPPCAKYARQVPARVSLVRSENRSAGWCVTLISTTSPSRLK